MQNTTRNPLSRLDLDDFPATWSRHDLDRITDDDLLASASELLTIPHEESADSFTLHAPLELMARAQLLPSVSPHRRRSARQRIAQIAATWMSTGTTTGTADDAPVGQPIRALVEALRDGDVETVDRAFVSLCAIRNQEEIVGDLADIVLPHLGGAAHGSIFLELLPRFRPAGTNGALMGRTLLRDLAEHPASRLSWFDEPRTAPLRHGSLTERLLAPRAERKPASHFVQPTMSLIEDTGLAHRTLADVTHGMSIERARRELLAIAAMSMLQDDPANAPYGWTHCLTLPQAALAIADRSTDPQRAVDIAATYVLGYRATQSSTPIDPNWQPDPPAAADIEAITALDPSTAASAAWHATAEQRGLIVQQLIDHAAPHRDAHLAKYTLACLDAGSNDPTAPHLYLAAAAYLAAWWRHHDQSEGTTP